MSLSKRVFILILFTLVYSCSQDDELTAEFPEPVISIVNGTVTTDGNQPVDSVQVTAFHRNGCETNSRTEPWTSTTNAEGKFEIKFQLYGGIPQSPCYLVEAIPSDTTKVKVPNLKQINPDFRKIPPFDTARVNFSLDRKN